MVALAFFDKDLFDRKAQIGVLHQLDRPAILLNSGHAHLWRWLFDVLEDRAIFLNSDPADLVSTKGHNVCWVTANNGAVGVPTYLLRSVLLAFINAFMALKSG